MRDVAMRALVAAGGLLLLAGCSPGTAVPAGGIAAGGGSPQSMPQPANSLPAGAANSSVNTPSD